MVQEGQSFLQQDPAVMLEIMLLAGEDLESIAANLLGTFGPDHASNALAMMAMTAPVVGVRGLAHLASMGVGVKGLASRLEALNLSPWSLVTSEKVSVKARVMIAESLGGDLKTAVHENGLRIVDRYLPALDDGMVVDGSLYLYRVLGMDRTPDRLYVEKNLDIWDCPDLHTIGDSLVVKKLMHLRACRISTWPNEVNVAELDVEGMPRGPLVKTAPRRRFSSGSMRAI